MVIFLKYKIIIGLILVILACCGIYAAFNGNHSIENSQIDISQLEAENNIIVSEQRNMEKKLFSSDKADTNAILVENNSTLNIKDSVVNKTGDSSDNSDNVDFYGTNSAILVKKGSSATINDVEIYTNSTGSNAVFVTNAQPNDESSTGNSNGNMMSNEQPPSMPENGDGGQPMGIPEGGNGEQPDSMPEEQPTGDNNGNNVPMTDTSGEDYSSGGANAVMNNVIINTYQDKSRGIDATYGGNVTADNVLINTRGGSCAALATDRGEGTVVVDNSELNTGVDNGTGRGSPIIYSTGDISVSNCKGTAYVSQIACIEGKNSITMNDCDFNSFAGGNREENGEYVDLGGIFIYQSMSGDANVGTATLDATNTKLSIDENSEHYSKAPMFHVTNTKAIINITGCELSFGSGTLLDVSGQNQWGDVGSNGGDLEFNAVKEKLDGNICVDEISSLVFNMKDSDYTGTINSDDTYGNTSVSIDSGSSWTLTGDGHVTSLENRGNIEYGEYALYVNGEKYTKNNPYPSK